MVRILRLQHVGPNKGARIARPGCSKEQSSW